MSEDTSGLRGAVHVLPDRAKSVSILWQRQKDCPAKEIMS